MRDRLDSVAGIIELLSMPVGDVWALLLGWLRRPRHAKSGTLPPVVVTDRGVIVPSVERVPIRSTKADAKRHALAWARRHWREPNMTWGQARKRIKRLEARMRTGQMDAGMAEVIANLGDE